MEEHNAAVQRISNRLADFYSRKQPYRIFHGSTNSTRNYKVDPSKMIDTSSLTHVLAVNTDTKTALVEPNVPMDQLVDATLPYGLVPPVVMEFPGITVGGGFAGTSGESSSFKHGFFDSTITSLEFVLPTGEIMHASPSRNEDLFYGAAGSFGTLGVATLFEISLVPAAQYVEVTYTRFPSAEATLAAMQTATEDAMHDYVDGILAARDHGILITGHLTSNPSTSAPVQSFTAASDPWFYIHATRATLRATAPVRFAVPLRSYLFRYDRGAFWTGKYAFSYFMTPFNRITRWALDPFMKTRVMYHALHASGHAQQYVIQDLALPAGRAREFIDWVDVEMGCYPLWLCPLKPGTRVSLHPCGTEKSGEGAAQLVNVGVWGPGPKEYGAFVALNRKLEAKVRELGGMKWLYAQAFYTEDEFWSIYDKKWYDELRQKYHANHLPNVFDKVRVDFEAIEAGKNDDSWEGWLRNTFWSIWPMTGLYGVAKTLTDGQYLLSK